MPIYEFVCESCGRLLEVMQKVSDPPPAACPECGEGRMARTVSRTSFQLKGGGWYSDLYASTRARPGGSEPATASKAEATPAAKPATPTAPAAPTTGGGGSGSGSSAPTAPGSGSSSGSGSASGGSAAS